MRVSSKTYVGAAAGLCLLVVSLEAEAFRCAGDLISRGDTREKVLSACGAPTSRTRFVGAAVYDLTTGLRRPVVVEQLRYDRGPNAFVTDIRIENGRVSRVTTSGRGSIRRPAAAREPAVREQIIPPSPTPYGWHRNHRRWHRQHARRRPGRAYRGRKAAQRQRQRQLAKPARESPAAPAEQRREQPKPISAKPPSLGR
jgi:hypothetical protein